MSKPTRTPAAARAGRRRWAIPLIAVIAVLALIVGLVIWAPWTGPPPPKAVRAQSSTATSVLIKWVPSTGDPTVDRYLIRRNGVQVSSLPRTATSYQDNGLAPATTYRYSIVAVSGTMRGDPSADVRVKTLAAGPAGLTAGTVTSSSVTFHWSRPATAPDSYVILRDGTEIGTAPGVVTSYQDNGLVPVTEYGYAMVAVLGGVRSAPSSVLVVKTHTPSVSSARLEGSWTVDTKVIKSGGDTPKVGFTDTYTWQLTPRCTTGPCAVVVSGEVGNQPLSMTLTRAGAVYAGTTRTHISDCGGKGVVDTVTLRITIRKAGMDSQAWTARSWVGTMRINSPYTSLGSSYCPAHGWTISLTTSR